MGLRVSFICMAVGQGNSTEDQNNLSETMLCQISDEIIRVQGWNFLALKQYIFCGYFFSPTL